MAISLGYSLLTTSILGEGSEKHEQAMSTSTKNLQRKLLERFGNKAATLGFKKQISQHRFYQPIEGGVARIFFAFIHHVGDFDVTISVGVRFNAVEDLVQTHSDFHLSKREKAQTTTLGIELGNLSVGEQKRWTVSSEEHIASVANSMFEYFKQVGEPYLLEYSSLEAAYELLSSDDRDKSINCPFQATRAKKLIAMAILLGHSDVQSQISSRKKFLQGQSEFDLSEFLIFVDNWSASQ